MLVQSLISVPLQWIELMHRNEFFHWPILFWLFFFFFAKQFSSWWSNEHEICRWILQRDVWIYDSVLASSLSSSRKSEEGKLSANGGEFDALQHLMLTQFWSNWTSTSQACKIVEGQRYTKRLNEKQITSLLKVTCQRPREQEMDILQVKSLNCLINVSRSIY